MTGPAVDSAARPVDGPVDVPASGPAAARWRGEPLLESRAYLELARLLAAPVWRGHGVPAGDGRTVLLLPGYLAGDRHAYRAVAEALATPSAPADPGHR